MLQFPCDAFQKNPDGTWTCIKPVTVQTPMGELKFLPGMTFRKGAQYDGIDVATLLDQKCT